jgi:peptidyl-prolyl cis-trans isomerase D
MLEKIRDGSQGWIAKTILGIVILTFALAGIGSYLGNSSVPAAAIVNGEEISKTAYDQKYQANRARMEQQFGQMFAQLAADDSYMNTFKEGVLDQLIAEELQTQLAESIGLRISNEKIKDMIRKMPEFQTDGKFDNDRYLQVLRQAGYQTSAFRDYMRVDTTRRQVAQSIATTDFSLTSEVARHTELDKQTRDIEYIVFKHGDFTDKVEITEADSDAYYHEHQENFRTQEQVSLQYVEVKVSDIMKEIAVSDEQLQSHYQDNIGSYRTNVTRRRASHIQIEFGDDEAAAKTKADEILAKIKAGEDFAELAKTSSDDTFSGENGGDLEWFEKGVMGEEFDEVAFGLAKVDDVSEVVRAESGFHIIKLTGDEPESVKSFETVKTEVTEAYKRNQANEIFTDKQNSLSELSFEQPDSLEDAADAIGGKVQETAFFTRNSAPAAVNYPKALVAAFSDQVLLDNLNSDLIEINDDHVMVVRLVKHMPTRIKSEDEVADQIKTALTAEKSQEMAKTQAEEALAKLDGSAKLTGNDSVGELTVVAKEGLERFTSDVDSDVRTEVFKMPHPGEGKVTTQVIQMSNSDYALVALSGVTAGKVPEDVKATEQRIASQKSQIAYKNFVEALKEKAEITKLAIVSDTTTAP